MTARKSWLLPDYLYGIDHHNIFNNFIILRVMIGYELLVIGINIILSIFLSIVSARAIKKGLRILSYTLMFFIVILASMIMLSLQYFGVTIFSGYTVFIVSFSDFIMLIILYAGILRGSVH